MEFFKIQRDIPFMRHALVFNIISFVTFALALTDTTMAATHLRGQSWGTTASNASGTCTVTLTIRSAAATATQTCRLHRFVIRKVTPT